MISDTTGWGLSDRELLRTTGGGLHWKNVTPAANMIGADHFASPLFLDEQTACVPVNRSTGWFDLFTTADAGQTWGKVTPEGQPRGYVITCDFIDRKRGWLLVGLGMAMGNEDVAVYRTSDGGQQWQQIAGTRPPHESITRGGAKTGITFIDENTGWMTADSRTHVPFLLQTSDGGRSWIPQTLEVPSELQDRDVITKPPVFTSANDGMLLVSFVGGYESQVFTTSDGGVSWQPTSTLTPLPQTRFGDPTFVGSSNGWIANEERLFRTPDGGRHWESISTPKGVFGTKQVQFVNEKVGWILKRDGTLFVTKDSGMTWDLLTPQLSE
jgi:photosystem II stability/assembly factor-like uncharacterized protein